MTFWAVLKKSYSGFFWATLAKIYYFLFHFLVNLSFTYKYDFRYLFKSREFEYLPTSTQSVVVFLHRREKRKRENKKQIGDLMAANNSKGAFMPTPTF